MTWLFTLLAMTVIAVVAGVVTGRIGGVGMDAPASSLPFRGLPPEQVAPEDLETLRFSPALRGYRMDEVDQVLDRLVAELRRRDEEIASLRDRAVAHPPADGDLADGAEQGRPGEQGPADEAQPGEAQALGRRLPGRN